MARKSSSFRIPLGARLVIPAIAYVDRTAPSADSSNISNIILASPDFDRETFERDIANDVLALARVARDRRITAYAPRSDKALAASRALHGYPRLGSPYCFDPARSGHGSTRKGPARTLLRRRHSGPDDRRHHRHFARIDGAQRFPAQRARLQDGRHDPRQAQPARTHAHASRPCLRPPPIRRCRSRLDDDLQPSPDGDKD